MWTQNGYHMKFNRDFFRPSEGYKNQRRAIMKMEQREPDNFDRMAALFPRGIASSAGTGAMHKRTDLRLASVDAYFPSAPFSGGDRSPLKNRGFDPKYTASRVEHWKDLCCEEIEGGVALMETAKPKKLSSVASEVGSQA